MSKRHIDSDENSPPGKVAKSSNAIDSTHEIYTSVLLHIDGSFEEVKTSLVDANTILGGGSHFHGGWAENNTIMLVNSNQTDEGLELNRSILQPPFHKHTIRGNILIIKTDNNGNRTDFTLSEYKNFLSLDIEEWELDNEEDDGNIEYDDNNDDDDIDDAALYDDIIASVNADCVSKFSRDMTEEESELIIQLVGYIGELLRSFQSDDENVDLEKISNGILNDVRTWFSETFSRSPSEEEDIIISLTVNRVVISAVEGNRDADLVNKIYEQFVNNFRTENSRSPTEEEIVDIRQQCEQLVSGMEPDDEDDDNAEYEDD